MLLEEIARVVGHSGTATTETVYQHQLKPVIESGGLAMDKILGNGVKPKRRVVRRKPKRPE
jgi:hypothetical protein